MSDSSDHTYASQEHFRNIRDSASSQLQELDQQIKAIKQNLDDNYHKIKLAKKSRAPYKQLNELHRQRKNIIQKLKTTRKHRNDIKTAIDSARHNREITGTNYITYAKRVYSASYSPK